MSAVTEAVQMLRGQAILAQADGETVAAGEFATTADALAAYFAEPPAEEVERLARALYDGAAGTDNDEDAIRAVLKAIAGAEP